MTIKHLKFVGLAVLLSAGLLMTSCQKQPLTDETAETGNYELKTAKDGDFTYEYVTGDPLKARIYTLENGLKVYLTVNKSKPRIQTYVAIGAGSKNDPATATGLAHYLEHMVFKGTSKLGTNDWAKEKVLLDSVEYLFNEYRKLTDPAARKAMYRTIDAVSGRAAKFAVANEYDKLMTHIGAQGTNAYTWVDQTVYVNDIPTNAIEKWANIEAERFGEMVPRLFHTELEAVYEEKNRGLDSDQNKLFEAILKGLFPTHTYGTQTTIGTIEHLKNPSITEIKKFFDTYYVPNNMAVCMSGDLDPSATIKVINQTFGKLKRKDLPKLTQPEQPEIGITKYEIMGPSEESVALAWRIPGVASNNVALINVVASLLTNGKAGIVDVNLNQQQKVLGASAFTEVMKEYGMEVMIGNPRQGQTLDQVRDLMLDQMDSLAQGRFADDLLPAIINNFKLERMRALEDNARRADVFVGNFVNGVSYLNTVKTLDDASKITKKDVQDFARKYFKRNNYVIVYKRVGQDKSIQKVEKPAITPVAVNREQQSAFFSQITKMSMPELKPEFVDYDKEISKTEIRSGLVTKSVKNNLNKLFELRLYWPMGTDANNKLQNALGYLDYLGTDKMSNKALKQELYKLGLDIYSDVQGDQTSLVLSGLDENLEKGLELAENWMLNAKADETVLANLKADQLKAMADAKLNKGLILRQGLARYAVHGAQNSFTSRLKPADINALTSSELLSLLKTLLNTVHEVHYYGPRDHGKVVDVIKANHKAGQTLQAAMVNKTWPELPFDKPRVLFVNYDMVQADMMFMALDQPYSADLDVNATIFNEYFDGSMGSIVFQELRESKALAYSTFSRYMVADRKGEHSLVMSGIGTQADKLSDAMAGMTELLTNLPQNQANLDNAIKSLKAKLESERDDRKELIMDQIAYERVGETKSTDPLLYSRLSNYKMADLVAFHKAHIAGKNRTVIMIGNTAKVDMKALAKYGEVKVLTLQDVFGY